LEKYELPFFWGFLRVHFPIYFLYSFIECFPGHYFLDFQLKQHTFEHITQFFLFILFKLQAIKSPSLDYSHFISLPLAIHPELVDKLLKFQNSILGNRDGCPDDNPDSDSNEDTSDNEDGDQQTDKQPDVAVEPKVDGGNEHAKVNITKIPLVSYASKASKSSSPSGMPTVITLCLRSLKILNQEIV
jgi:hypothetical protein